MEGFGEVSGKGDDEEGANVLNVRIWVEGAVSDYEPRCVAKKRGNFEYVSARRGESRIPIGKKILCWNQYEGYI